MRGKFKEEIALIGLCFRSSLICPKSSSLVTLLYLSLRSVLYSTELRSMGWYLLMSKVRTGSNCFKPRLMGTRMNEW